MRNILILDDDNRWAEYTKEVMEQEGYQVHISTSPQRAIDKVKTIPCDVIILDLRLNDNLMAAEEAYYTIKEIVKDIKLIVVSGSENMIDYFKTFIGRNSIGLIKKKQGYLSELKQLLQRVEKIPQYVTEPPGAIQKEKENRTDKYVDQKRTVVKVLEQANVRSIHWTFVITCAVVLSAVLLLALVLSLSTYPLYIFLSGLGMTILSIEVIYFIFWYIKNKPPNGGIEK